MSRVAVAVRVVRAAVGLRKDQLAHKASLDRSYITLIENGKRMPREQAILAIFGAMDVEEWVVRVLLDPESASDGEAARALRVVMALGTAKEGA